LSRLAYSDRGHGAAVVLIHEHPFDRSMWAPQLRELAADLRLVAPDLPGYGVSPPLGEITTMRELAEAVLALLDELEARRATAVGLSMGGLVTMELALAHPQRVAGVVLVATTAAPVTSEEAATRRATADDIERDGMLAHALDMAAKLFGPAARANPDLIEAVFRMMIHTSPAGAAAALRGRAERPNYARLLPGLRVPSLVVAGDRDHWGPEPVVEQLVAALHDPQVLRLAGVGHLPNLEAPGEFNAALRSFVPAVAES
jgi:3-oxoadipate enol-lactonase